jgi:lipopolysaccharide/colanic/teichoic acid biosynthesis glycosyltransferase
LMRLTGHSRELAYNRGDGSPRQRNRRTVDGVFGRLLDVALTVPLIVVVVPLIVLLGLLIKIDSRGPIFYRCTRVGFHGRLFEMLKLRKMVEGASGPALTTADDARLTRCGRFLATTKLDELPQLWHVLKGEMSLVGPRPEDPAFVSLHSEEYEEIGTVRPGITGLCQLAFTREGAILDSNARVKKYVTQLLPAKVQLDLFYSRNKSTLMDVRILFWTVLAVVLRKDVAVHRHTGRLSIRRRPQVPELVARELAAPEFATPELAVEAGAEL